MLKRSRRVPPRIKYDLRSPQRFRGVLGVGKHSMSIRFTARIDDKGEVELHLNAFRITSGTQFILDHWHRDGPTIPEFSLRGATEDGLKFETDSLSFTSLGESWTGAQGRWSKPSCYVRKTNYARTVAPPHGRTTAKLHLKGFECFPDLYADCRLGKVVAAGEASLAEPNRLNGFVAIEADTPPPDVANWRADAEKLLEHCRRVLSLASSTMLQAPILEFIHADYLEVEVLAQKSQPSPQMRVFHKLNLQSVLDAAIASYFDPPVDVKNLFFAIEWFAMETTYNEVRLVNAMTALENLINSNLTEKDVLIESKETFKKITRKAVREVINTILGRWPPDHAEFACKELNQKLDDLNRCSLRHKLFLLAARWQVPLDEISEKQVQAIIKARNDIVHRGYYPRTEGRAELRDQMTLVRELVVRFLLTAIGYRGDYISHFGGYRHAYFPPSDGKYAPKSCE